MQGKLFQFDDALRHEIVCRAGLVLFQAISHSILTHILQVNVLIRDVSK